MKYLDSSYKGTADTLNILCLNDLHIGAPSADMELLSRCVRFAKENEENTRVLLNGDYIEGVLKNSKGDIYEVKLSPKEQIDWVVDILQPIAHLIDGATIGNHDWRIEKETSIDVVEMIMRYLGIEEKYLGSRGIVGFSTNKMFYSVDMHHGTGGGSTIAAVENAMKRIWKSDTDIMYCGHWHKEFTKVLKRYSVNKRYKKVTEEKKILLCGNTILNTAEYAIRGAYEESFPSQAIIKLNAKGQKKDVDINWIR